VTAKSCIKPALFAAARWAGVNALLRRVHRRRLLVLCYHGVVADDHPEDPGRMGVAVSLREFQEQMLLLMHHFAPISFEALLESQEKNTRLPDHPVLITFDDGLRNSLTCAAPVLERLGAPAVFFVTTGLIANRGLLWTHELYERVLAWNQPSLPMPDDSRDVATPPSLTGRIELAGRISGCCKRISDDARLRYLERLRNAPLILEQEWHRELYEMLTWDEARTLSAKGFEIGSHTVTHPILTRLDVASLRCELRDSKAAIERELGKVCRCIAYPNGGAADVNPTVVRVAREAGYALGVTLSGRINAKSPSMLEIDRLCVTSSLSRNAFRARLSGLASLIGRA